MIASRLQLGRRSIEAFKVVDHFELRLLEESEYVTSRIVLTNEHLRRLVRSAVAIGPIILLDQHPNMKLFFNGSIWADFDRALWSLLLGSQIEGDPRIVTATDVYSDGRSNAKENSSDSDT